MPIFSIPKLKASFGFAAMFCQRGQFVCATLHDDSLYDYTKFGSITKTKPMGA